MSGNNPYYMSINNTGSSIGIQNNTQFFLSSNRFCLLRRLSEGEFGITHLVENVYNGKMYVMKSSSSSVQISDYEKIKHPNIAELVSHFIREEERQCMIFPYYENGTLKTYLTIQQTNLTPRKTLSWFLDAGKAVQYLHNMGKSKIDIRPGNLYFDGNWNVILFYKYKHKNTEYSAPEFVIQELGRTTGGNNNNEPDKRCDVWSLGCLLYNLFYLKSPLQDIYKETDYISEQNLKSINFPLRSHISKEMSDLMQHMMQYCYSDRPYIDKVIATASDYYRTLT